MIGLPAQVSYPSLVHTLHFKNIMSKAFPLFKDGHIQDITVCTTNNKSFFQAKCLPKMKKNTIYTIRLVLDKNSADIEYAQCGCAAGRGPTGSCKHIAAKHFIITNMEPATKTYLGSH